MTRAAMKSQDIGILLKLISLQKQEREEPLENSARSAWPDDWQDWEIEGEQTILPGIDVYKSRERVEQLYTVRALERETGISKSIVNASLSRCKDVGLLHYDRALGVPRANKKALLNFIVHGIKYVFPAKPAELTRGIATAFASPILKNKVMSPGDFVLVWPEATGNTKGLSITPLFKSVTYAVKRDPEMYSMLALIDAIRTGLPREANMAAELLTIQFEHRR